MARKGDDNLVVGLDIGTSKELAIVGDLSRPVDFCESAPSQQKPR